MPCSRCKFVAILYFKASTIRRHVEGERSKSVTAEHTVTFAVPR